MTIVQEDFQKMTRFLIKTLKISFQGGEQAVLDQRLCPHSGRGDAYDHQHHRHHHYLFLIIRINITDDVLCFLNEATVDCFGIFVHKPTKTI